jgi:hypothetical protein
MTMTIAVMGRPLRLGIARAGLAERNVARSALDLASTLSPEKLFPSTCRSVRLRRARTTPAARRVSGVRKLNILLRREVNAKGCSDAIKASGQWRGIADVIVVSFYLLGIVPAERKGS